MKSVMLLRLLVLISFCTATPFAVSQTAEEGPWERMDYGPFLSSTVELAGPVDNFAYKGISVPLGSVDGDSDSPTVSVTFDSDLLRYAFGWTGNFIQLKGVVFDGEHWAYPLIDGVPFFHTSMAPGASPDAAFSDGREIRYGPLPKETAHYKGLYLHGDRVLFRYTVGRHLLIEMPSLERTRGAWAFRRDLNIGIASGSLFLNLCETSTRDAIRTVDVSGHRIARIRLGEDMIAAAVLGDADYAWLDTLPGRIAVEIPERRHAAKLAILLWRGAASEFEDFAALVRKASQPEDLSSYMQGGPPRWPKVLSTRGKVSVSDGSYVIDEIVAPEDNPWQSWMRFGGLDFFDDDSSAVLSTWNGDVWTVSGIDDSLQKLRWRRVATGLFQPLGVKVVDGKILALGRDQITRLHDLNGDGEADYYENFNNDHQVSEHFHEFALDIQQGSDGELYYTKGARHARDAIFPQHGTLLRVSEDGAKTDILANGFRAPNGLGLSPTGEFWISDNEGHWHPANRINIVEPGGFYGNRWSYVGDSNVDQYDPPLCWIHPSVDRSPGTFVWPPDDRWGPFQDKPITISYGMGRMFLVLDEEVEGVRQGGVVRFPLEFETGVMRAKFRPTDGQLYLAGLFGWAGNKTKAGGFYRVRYTGAPVYMPEAFEVGQDGVRIHFTDPVDPDTASNAGNYFVQAWNYEWTEQYGSPDYRFDGSEGRERFDVRWVALSPDNRTVYLRIPDLQPVMQLRVRANVTFSSGEMKRHDIYTTVHKMGEWTLEEALGRETQGVIGSNNEGRAIRPGMLRTVIRNDRRDSTVVRTAALYAAEGDSVSPFLDPGVFQAAFEGYINADIRETYYLDLEGRGRASLQLNGDTVIEPTELESNPRSESILLKQGLNAIKIEYDAPVEGDAALRVYWSSGDRYREPIPPAAFRYVAGPRELESSERHRRGRFLVAEFRCLRCHRAPELETGGMPELAWGAPDLAKAGAWFKQTWLADWIRKPEDMRPNVTMPRLLNARSEVENEDRAVDLAAYLVSLATETAPPSSPFPDLDHVALGEGLYGNLGCASCHQLEGVESSEGAPRNGLLHLASKWKRGSIANYLMAPEQFHPGGRMPNFRLSEEESGALESFLLSRSETPARGERLRGDPANGRRLLESIGCLSCHDLPGHVNRATAPTFSELSDADWTEACLVTVGLREDGVPIYPIEDEEGRAIREVLIENGPSLGRYSPLEFASRQLERLECGACHSIDGAPSHWPEGDPAPGAAAEDVSIHATRPSLDMAGEKLRGEWIEELLAGSTSIRTRPHSTARMPAFPTYARPLSQGIAAMHGYPDVSEAISPPKPEEARVGASLAGPDSLHCGACHGLGPQAAAAGRDTETVNFADIPRRLRPSFYDRFMMAPEQVLPGSMMPSYVDDEGRSTLRAVLDGDAAAQFNAIWNYMLSLGARPGTTASAQ